jgi:hypothetical protein
MNACCESDNDTQSGNLRYCQIDKYYPMCQHFPAEWYMRGKHQQAS